MNEAMNAEDPATQANELTALWESVMREQAEPLALTHRLDSNAAEVLLYYDGPLLAWLPVAGRRLLAYALAPVTGELDADAPFYWPFVVVEMTDAAVSQLNAGTLSLRQAVLEAPARYLMPDYYVAVPEIRRIHAALPDDWLPGDGPFYPVEPEGGQSD